MSKKTIPIKDLKLNEEQKKEHMKLLKEILDRNYIFTDHIFKASEIEIIRKK